MVLGTVGGFWSIIKIVDPPPVGGRSIGLEGTARVAEQSGKIDPMHQFLIEPLFGRDWEIAGQSIAFTNSALWMALTLRRGVGCSCSAG